MMKSRWYWLAGLLLGLVGTPAAFATTDPESRFVSFHQSEVTYVTAQDVDAAGNLVQTKVSYIGFKNQFAPTGAPGCTMGIASLRSECVIVTGGLSFQLPGAQPHKEFKVYVPAGTTRFTFGGYLPQGVEYAVAVRAGTAPGQSSALDALQYEITKSSQNPSTVFERLSNMEEVVMVHNGGGSMSLAGNNDIKGGPLAKGVWLYFRVLNGEYVDTPRATYEIDVQRYIDWYNQAVFGPDGDPIEGAATTPVALSSISLSANSLTVGTQNTVSITPNPSTASLGSCVPTYTGTMQDLVVISGSNITLGSGAGVITTDQTVIIQCDNNAQATLTILPSPSLSMAVTEVNTQNSVDWIVNVGLGGLTPAQANNARVWVIGYVPANPYLGLGTASYVFLTGPKTWQFSNITNPADGGAALDGLVFQRVPQFPQELRLYSGVKRSDLMLLKAQLYVFYQIQNGPITSLGTVFPR